MTDVCSMCACTPDANGACACITKEIYSCGYCGSDVAVGKRCFCQGSSEPRNSAGLNPMSFEPTAQGFRITFENGWSVATARADLAIPEKIRIQAFMPQGFPIRAFGREEWIVNCNDLAVILDQTRQIPNHLQVSEEHAAQSFEAMLEGLMFGVAA